MIIQRKYMKNSNSGKVYRRKVIFNEQEKE